MLTSPTMTLCLLGSAAATFMTPMQHAPAAQRGARSAVATMGESVLVLGTRGSPLALAQAYETKKRLAEAFPDELSADDAVEIRVIKTTGDMVLDKALKDVGGKGLFTNHSTDKVAWQQPMRPPTAPEAHPPAQGCPLGPEGEPLPRGCRREAAAALRCLPRLLLLTCRPLDCRRKELDVSLLNGDVDCCVHSMKDVPTWLVPGTILPCTLPREDTRDAWISPSGKLPQDLPDGAAACRHQEPGPLQ